MNHPGETPDLSPVECYSQCSTRENIHQYGPQNSLRLYPQEQCCFAAYSVDAKKSDVLSRPMHHHRVMKTATHNFLKRLME